MIGDKTPLVEEYSKLFLNKLPTLQSTERLPIDELIELVINTLEVLSLMFYHLHI